MSDPIRLPIPNVAPAREAPHNIEAEQGLLGAILLNNAALDKVSNFLEPTHFFDPLHGQIYEVARRVIQGGRLASPVTLKTFFSESEPIRPHDGGAPMPVDAYLGTLAVNGTSLSSVRDYGQTVYDLHVRRRMAEIADSMLSLAHEAPIDAKPSELIAEAEAQLDGLRIRGRNERELSTIYQAMCRSIEQTNAAYIEGGGIAGLSTGLPSLDAKLGGLAPSDLIVLGARPGMGKSALAATIGLNVAKSGAGAAFFSLEMSSEQIGTRALASATGISADRQRRGQIEGDGDMKALLAAAAQYRDVPFYIDESGGVSLAQLIVNVRRHCRTRRIGLIIVDYLQIMNGSDTRQYQNRVQELTQITTKLKALAKELNLPVLLLSQLNRKLEDRDEKRPGLADLRESGSIEQDADIVLFIHREEYWHAKDKPGPDAEQAAIDKWQREMDACAGKAEVIIAKHRHGPTGTVELGFDGPRTLFTDRG